MKCVICEHGDTEVGNTTIAIEKKGVTVVIKQVPAKVCQNCSEAYVEEATAENVLKLIQEAVRAGVQLEIRTYVAA